MAEQRSRPSFCLARVRNHRTPGEELERIVSASLRATDTVQRRDGEVLAAIPGDEAAAQVALERILTLRPSADLAVTLVTREHPEFPGLAADLGWPREQPVVRPPVPSATDPRRPATAVIVDDEADVRRMLASLVGSHGWAALLAESGHEVMDLCRACQADVLVIDYYLGGGATGVDAALECRRAGLGMPIIMFTASSWPTAAGDAGRIGGTVISKSNLTELLSTLDNLADRLRRSHRRPKVA